LEEAGRRLDAERITILGSSVTALGVLRGIEACVQFKLNRKDLEGLTVALQVI
ncbi:MAG: hypothetical protein HY998_00870, partial [candidate division NC10 bacterium]|nr:hypothetical protein [candidate division NC10 bacterium]